MCLTSIFFKSFSTVYEVVGSSLKTTVICLLFIRSTIKKLLCRSSAFGGGGGHMALCALNAQATGSTQQGKEVKGFDELSFVALKVGRWVVNQSGRSVDLSAADFQGNPTHCLCSCW